MTTDKYINENKTDLFKKGDEFLMHTCHESTIDEYKNKVWICQTDSFLARDKTEVVFLEGFSGYFNANFLKLKQSLNPEIIHLSTPEGLMTLDLNEYKKQMDFENGNEVLEFIKTVRESFVGSEHIYTRGSCYQFYKILKLVFPSAEAFYDMDHVITRINDKYYDITGEVEKGKHIEIHNFPESTVQECKFSIYSNVIMCDDCGREATIP